MAMVTNDDRGPSNSPPLLAADNGIEAVDEVFADFGMAGRTCSAFANMPIPSRPIRTLRPRVRNRSGMRTMQLPSPPEKPDRILQVARGSSFLLMLVGLTMLAMPALFSYSWSPFRDTEPGKAATAIMGGGVRTKPIQDMRVGERTVGSNPIREQVAGIEPDPATWRKVDLFMAKESGLGLWIELLRPLEWIEAVGAAEGETIYLDLAELGAEGEAQVTYLGPCPPIQPGSGPIVTGTFKHQADENTEVIELRLEGQNEPTGVTSNHPYWSVDRQEFVEVGRLRRGERVDTLEGTRRVVSVTPVEYSEFLYNMETTEHVYRVGALGTLVHNECAFVRYVSQLEATRSVASKGLHVDKSFNGKFKNVADAIADFDPKTLGPKNATQFSHKLTIELKPGAREWLRKKGVTPPLGHGPETWQIPAELIDEFNKLFVKSVTAVAR